MENVRFCELTITKVWGDFESFIELNTLNAPSKLSFEEIDAVA